MARAGTEPQPDAVVADSDFEDFALQTRFDAQGATLALRPQPMLDRVLGQRQHRHGRHACFIKAAGTSISTRSRSPMRIWYTLT